MMVVFQKLIGIKLDRTVEKNACLGGTHCIEKSAFLQHGVRVELVFLNSFKLRISYSTEWNEYIEIKFLCIFARFFSFYDSSTSRMVQNRDPFFYSGDINLTGTASNWFQSVLSTHFNGSNIEFWVPSMKSDTDFNTFTK